MNQQTQQDPNSGLMNLAPQAQKQGPEIREAPYSKIEPKVEVIRHPTSKAANGDDDLMSKQQMQSMPSVDELTGKWKQQVGAAKIAWAKLTEDELLELEGHEQKLTGLIQQRYAITRDEAEKQVKTFFEKFRA